MYIVECVSWLIYGKGMKKVPLLSLAHAIASHLVLLKGKRQVVPAFPTVESLPNHGF